eukprot:2735813-Pleurochrysis_carterae.AAC.2
MLVGVLATGLFVEPVAVDDEDDRLLGVAQRDCESLPVDALSRVVEQLCLREERLERARYVSRTDPRERVDVEGAGGVVAGHRQHVALVALRWRRKEPRFLEQHLGRLQQKGEIGWCVSRRYSERAMCVRGACRGVER